MSVSCCGECSAYNKCFGRLILSAGEPSQIKESAWCIMSVKCLVTISFVPLVNYMTRLHAGLAYLSLN